jgi:glc operon protein GlcG
MNYMKAFTAHFQSLTAEGAKKALEAVETEAHRNGWALCIAVTDDRGELLAFHRMDGALLPSIEASIIKARTAARLRMSSKDFEQYATPITAAVLSHQGLGPLEGGVPVILNGLVVGAVGTSGARTGPEDTMASLAGVSAIHRGLGALHSDGSTG